MIGPRGFYLLASAVLAAGIGMAFMDGNGAVETAGMRAAKPPAQAAPPSAQVASPSRSAATADAAPAPAPRSTATAIAPPSAAIGPAPNRRAEITSLTTNGSEADELAGPAPKAPPEPAPKAQAASEPPATARIEREPKPTAKPAAHRTSRRPVPSQSRRVAEQRAQHRVVFPGASADAPRMVMPGPDGYVR